MNQENQVSQTNKVTALAVQSPLLVIVGETASGKSELALELAKRLNGEIICADSWTVRREVSIGTAKPTKSEQNMVKHHLLDIVDPDADFTAAVFKTRALEAIDDIAARGKLPIMVGGTGLYIDGVIYDYGFLKEGDRKAREELNSKSVAQLLQMAKERDLDTSTIDTRNKRRIIRLIETSGAKPSRKNLRPNTLIIGLKQTREELKQKIHSRTDQMIKNGLEQEVRQLADKYGWECEALKGVGYAQWKGYFESQTRSQNNQISIEEVAQKINKATFDLAKRQRTWFKRNKSIHWFLTPVNMDKIVELATTFLTAK